MRAKEPFSSRQCNPVTLSVLFSAAIITLTQPLFGQNTESTEVSDIENRRASVVNLEQHIGQRQQRLSELLEDIRTLDARLEDRVDQVIEMIGSVKDSQESKVRVARTKAEVIAGLRRTAEYYKKNRDAIREQLRKANPSVPRETLEHDMEVFDKRIEKRIEQILTLTKTFTDPKELAKYETTSTSYWGGWSLANEEISEEWKQNRRESRHTESAGGNVIDGLRKSIDYLQQRNAWFAEKLKDKKLSAIERNLYQADMDRNANLILTRKEQLEDFLTSKTPQTKSLQRNDAHEMELLIQDTRGDLREDFFTIFRKYSELNKGRAELEKLTTNLEARKEWLKDYDSKHNK